MKQFCKTALDVLKNTLQYWFFTISVCLLCVAIMMIKNHTVVLLLLAVMLCVYLLMCFVLARQIGEKNYKTTVALEARIRYAAEHGVEPDGGVKLHARFRPWKGFAIVAVVHIPLLILLILCSALTGKAAENAEVAVIFAYSVYSGIVRYISVKASVWFFLIGAAMAITAGGLGYVSGGIKQMRVQYRIERRHREIYGEDEQ